MLSSRKSSAADFDGFYGSPLIFGFCSLTERSED